MRCTHGLYQFVNTYHNPRHSAIDYAKSCKGNLSSKSSLIIKIYAFAEKLTDLPRNRHNISQSLTKRLGAFPWSFALEAVLGTVEESALARRFAPSARGQ
jgi:hypothetical protein